MEKGKKIETKFHLPEAIIQHIQSFLTGKEAAQTTLLSKAWYRAWLTRSNLDFDQHYFQISENMFLEFVNETMKRYEKLNLKIDNLRLLIFRFDYGNRHRYSLVNELIMKALKIGVTCLDFKILLRDPAFTLPCHVFELINLTSLSVSRCNIKLGASGKVMCQRLKSLALKRIFVKGNIISDIVWSCPLIENLSLDLHDMPSIQFPEIGNVGSDIDRPFNKLKNLWLYYNIDLHAQFFLDLSSNFPSIKDLPIHGYRVYKGIKISSSSLECISFSQDKTLRMKFDVPSIRKFTFSSPIPLLTFKTTTSNWEFD